MCVSIFTKQNNVNFKKYIREFFIYYEVRKEKRRKHTSVPAPQTMTTYQLYTVAEPLAPLHFYLPARIVSYENLNLTKNKQSSMN